MLNEVIDVCRCLFLHSSLNVPSVRLRSGLLQPLETVHFAAELLSAAVFRIVVLFHKLVEAEL